MTMSCMNAFSGMSGERMTGLGNLHGVSCINLKVRI